MIVHLKTVLGLTLLGATAWFMEDINRRTGLLLVPGGILIWLILAGSGLWLLLSGLLGYFKRFGGQK